MDANRAAKYRAWVIERLTASMPSCRRVLKELCITVSLDPEHPFGPRFVHEILLQYETPAKRDVLPSWLDFVTRSNDPQMLEDVAMITFGAACLAGTDTRLADLVLWADTHWLMPESPKRQENIVVLRAARGIVERACVMGIDVAEATLERARTLYVVEDRLLPIDEKAAREADDHDGIRPITGDLAWYVVPGAIEAFFFGVFDGARHGQDKLDPQARGLLVRHANTIGRDDITPPRFAFGALMAILRNSGWNEREAAAMDLGVHRRYHKASHGSRSAIGGVV